MSFFSTYPHTEGLTMNFAAPEQTDGSGDVDCRTDIFAVGKILDYIERKLRRVEGAEGESYYLPVLWQAVKAKCLMPQKEERWQDIEDILSFLKGVKHRNKEKEKNRLWYVVAGILLLLVGIFAFLLSTRNDAATFADEYGNRYQVKSEEQQTCCLVGRDDTCTNVNLYIEPHISYKGKRYRVVEIGDNAFYGDNRLQTLCLPHTLRGIGSRAFRECKQLIVADIPDEVIRMDNMVFWGCERLSEVHIPKGLKAIPSSCFSKTALKRVAIPEGVTSIGYDAFGICRQLQSVVLPQSLQSIERGVFWRCSALKSIVIPEKTHEIGQLCLMECDSLTDVYNEARTPQRVVKLFGKKTASHIVLHVPAQSVGDYKKAECWNEVKRIVPTSGDIND